MRVSVTKQDIEINPTCPIEPALERATGHNWRVSTHCAERQVEVEEDGDFVFKTALIDLPDIAADYIVAAAAGEPKGTLEFDIEEPYLVG